jgi:hypothetical protein
VTAARASTPWRCPHGPVAGLPGKTGAEQDRKARDDVTNEGGRSGGQHAPQDGGRTDEPRQQGGQGSRQDIEREEADKGQGSTA